MHCGLNDKAVKEFAVAKYHPLTIPEDEVVILIEVDGGVYR